MSQQRSTYAHTQRRGEGGPALSPSTPNHRGGQGINDIVQSLNTRWRLDLSVWDRPMSPSNATSAQKAYNKIKFLYYSSRTTLHRILEHFNSHAAEKRSGSERLAYLLKLLTDEVGTPSTGRTSSGRQNFLSSQEKVLRSPLAGPNLTVDTDVPRNQHGTATAQTSAYAATYTTEPGTPTDEDEEYLTPPQSPTLAAVAPNRRAQMGPPVRNPGALDDLLERAKSKKRMSESSSEDEQSPKYSKTSHGRQPRESDQDIPNWEQQNHRHDSFSTSTSYPAAANTSFDSTTTSATTSAATSFSSVFSADGSRPTATTNTSFCSDTTEPDDIRYPDLTANLGPSATPTSSTTMGSLDDDTLLDVLRAHELVEEPLSQPLNDLSLGLGEEPGAHVDQGDGSGDAGHPITPETNGTDANIDSTPRKKSVHYQIRDLPNQGLFVRDTPPNMDKAPFIVRRESCRVASDNGIHPEEVMADYNHALSDYEKFWSAIDENPKCSKIKRRGPMKGWLAAKNDFIGFAFKGKLLVNTKNSGPVFNLQLEPLQMELSCRFERAFGSDRFLYLSVPTLEQKSLPSQFKSEPQFGYLKNAYQEWLLGEHSFLGRKWEVFHTAPQKRDKKAGLKRKDEDLGQRVILFATKGCDILSKYDFDKGLRDPSYYSKYHEMTIGEVYNWFIPLERNAEESFCKAYARLDLGLSKTTPTLTFKPSQVNLREEDTLADGTPEDTRFNDPTIEPDKYGTPTKLHVMSDGCAQISVGAARLVWKSLKRAGAIPSAFQARIGGAKGVWMLSAPTGTEDPKHLNIWIDITKSQLKFEPHEEDRNDRTFDINRLTFELVGYSSHHRAAELHNLFVPIMIDRGVPRDKLVRIMNERLDFEREQLLELVSEPRRLRKWVNEQGPMLEERVRDGAAPAWQAGLPQPLAEKIIFLLESGFSPMTSPFLAYSFNRFLDRQLTRIQQKLGIPLGRATHMYGVADPLGILEPGEIHMHFSSIFVDDMTGEAYTFLDNREVLVGRQPACRRSDMQKVRAVFKPELAHLVDIVVFASKGTYPLAAKLQGGDYDGDTFWLCWEPDLVSQFRNAPAPVETPSTETYGIEVERRTLRDVMGLGGPAGIDNFRKEAFAFKNAPDLLGICTNYHENLCYFEDCIDSPGINAICDIHDLLVDSAKQGYKFGMDAWRNFLRHDPRVPNRDPSRPAYKEAIKQSEEALRNLTRQKVKKQKWTPKEGNALDYLYFKVIVPHTEETLRQFDELFANADGSDANLQFPYDTLTSSSDDEVKEELKRLDESFAELYHKWGTLWNRKSDSIHTDEDNDYLERCFTSYQAIQPVNTECSRIRLWTEQLIPGVPTYWDVLKASALTSKYGKYPKKASFIFNMAGKELAYLKANSGDNSRILNWEMYGGLKPRKIKSLVRKRGGMDDEEAEDFETATEDVDVVLDEAWE